MPKAERDAELRLDDILQAIERIRSYVAGMTFKDFEASALTFDAVAMTSWSLASRSRACPSA